MHTSIYIDVFETRLEHSVQWCRLEYQLLKPLQYYMPNIAAPASSIRMHRTAWSIANIAMLINYSIQRRVYLQMKSWIYTHYRYPQEFLKALDVWQTSLATITGGTTAAAEATDVNYMLIWTYCTARLSHYSSKTAA